jgi:plasmid stabilization system protein ParE
MVKRKIIWSVEAKEDLYRILAYYTLRNRSKSYSVKLNRKLKEGVNLLLNHPELGIITADESVRGFNIESYIVFYENTRDEVIIHTIWDTRQNPENNTQNTR